MFFLRKNYKQKGGDVLKLSNTNSFKKQVCKSFVFTVIYKYNVTNV